MDGQIMECAPPAAPDNSAALEAVTVPPTNLLAPGVIFSAFAIQRGDLGSRQAPPRVEDPIALHEKIVASIVFGLSFLIVAGSIGAAVAKWFGWWQ